MSNPNNKPGHLTQDELATLRVAQEILAGKQLPQSPEIDGLLRAAQVLQVQETRNKVDETVEIPIETPSDHLMQAYFDIGPEVFESMDESLKNWEKHKLLGETMKTTFDTYLEASGDVISEAVFNKIHEMFTNYRAAFIDKKDIYNDLALNAKKLQLETLMKHPVFMKDNRAVPAIEALADQGYLNVIAPCRFQMFLDYDFEIGRSSLKEGFGADQVPVLSNLANSNALWESKDEALKRGFMASIGEALKYIAEKDPSTILDSIKARIAIMDRNRQHENHHEPQCCSSLSETEVITIKEIANALYSDGKLDEEAQEMMSKAFDYGYHQTNHAC